jgi:hypothetical protein
MGSIRSGRDFNKQIASRRWRTIEGEVDDVARSRIMGVQEELPLPVSGARNHESRRRDH